MSVALLNTDEVTVAEPLAASGGAVYGARPVFGGASRVPRAAGTWHSQRVRASAEESMVAVPPLQEAGPFFLDMGAARGGGGGLSASAELPPSGLKRGRRFVSGSRLSAAVARQRSKSDRDPSRPQRDEESWQQEVDRLKEKVAALEAEKAASRAKIVKADKEVGKLQKLVGDVLVEQTPSMANGECSNGLQLLPTLTVDRCCEQSSRRSPRCAAASRRSSRPSRRATARSRGCRTPPRSRRRASSATR